MPVTINGTTGIVTPAENTSALTVGSISGLLKATSGVVSQAVAGTDYSQLTLATAQTASGTAVDFTGIPSSAKRITVSFNGISTNGTSNIIIQIGGSAVETTGYSAAVVAVNTASAGTVFTSGFGITQANVAARAYYGVSIINLIGSNSWSHICNISQGDNTVHSGAGSKTLSDTLTRVRLTTVNGTDAFDAGTINISYE